MDCEDFKVNVLTPHLNLLDFTLLLLHIFILSKKR